MFTKAQIESIVSGATGFPLRKEYQPTAIATMINGYFGDSGALKILCGCGGGKSIMMGASIVLAVIHGAKKVVITAPTIALCRQLEDTLIDLFANFAKSGQKIPKGIKFFNVSCDGKPNTKVLTKEEIDEETEGLEDRKGTSRETESNEGCLLIKATRDTSLDHEIIRKEIEIDAVSIFFVCKPSFLKSFQILVAEVAKERDDDEFVIDISCHDEFHNFISQERNDRTRSILTKYKNYSKHNWFFSASKKQGERFSWTDPLFGDIAIDVPTYQLVNWGYLVPELKIYLVTAGMIKGISDAIRQYFGQLNVPDAEKFYREAAVIFAVIEHQLKISSIPKIIHFSSAVAFIRTMIKSPEFRIALDKVMSGLICYQMDGGTKKDARAEIFENLRSATEEMAYCLLQHSTCKEGIDCPNFNVATICRGMSEISLQQALGRVQRTSFGKEIAYLYLFVNGDEGQLAKLATFLHYNFDRYNYSIYPITDDYIGKPKGGQEFPNLDDIKIPMKNGKVTIIEYIEHLRAKEEQLKRLFDLSVLSEEKLDAACPI